MSPNQHSRDNYTHQQMVGSLHIVVQILNTVVTAKCDIWLLRSILLNTPDKKCKNKSVLVINTKKNMEDRTINIYKYIYQQPREDAFIFFFQEQFVQHKMTIIFMNDSLISFVQRRGHRFVNFYCSLFKTNIYYIWLNQRAVCSLNCVSLNRLCSLNSLCHFLGNCIK